jgi:hypothetical protein
MTAPLSGVMPQSLPPTAEPTEVLAPTSAPPGGTPAADLSKMPSAIATMVKDHPVLKPIFTGELPGVRVRPGVYYPNAWKLAESFDKLTQAGLDLYLAHDGSFVLYNPTQVEEKNIQKADMAGALKTTIPDWQDVTNETPQKPPPKVQKEMDEMYAKLGLAPQMGAQASGAGAPAPGGAAMPPGGGNIAADLTALANLGVPTPKAPPPSTQTAMARARVANAQVGSPTSGPSPGAGRVINNLAKPAI